MTPRLEFDQVTVSDMSGPAPVRLLDRVSLCVGPGELVALVGESGAGKSMIGSAAAGLLPAGCHVTAGAIRIDGERIDALPEAAMQAVRGRRVSLIPQNALAALHPTRRIGDQLRETIACHRPGSTPDQDCTRWLDAVGLTPARHYAAALAHQLSGGMRQRAVVALALCSEPSLVIADEPVSALDLPLRQQIVQLLAAMARDRSVAVLMITHDLAAAAAAARIVVLYAGAVIEEGPAAAILRQPLHPYTAALKDSTPAADARMRLRELPGVMPPPGRRPSGCSFAPRCASAMAICREQRPVLSARPGAVKPGDAAIACWLHA